MNRLLFRRHCLGSAFATLVCTATITHGQGWAGLPERVQQICQFQAGEFISKRAIVTETLVISADASDSQAEPAPKLPPSFHTAIEYLVTFKYPAAEIDFANTRYPDRPPLRLEVVEKEARSDCWQGTLPLYLLKDLDRSACIAVREIKAISGRYRVERSSTTIQEPEGEAQTYETRIRDRATGEVIYRYTQLFWDGKPSFLRFARRYRCGGQATASIIDILVPRAKKP